MTNTSPNDIDKRVLERIEKMLRLAANSAATPGEAATAAAMAANLMRKHNIDSADSIRAALETDDDAVIEGWIKHDFDNVSSRYPTWLNIMTTTAARYFDCHVRMIPTGKRSPSGQLYTSLKLFGYRADVVTAVWTIAYLVDTINRLADEYWAGLSSYDREGMSSGAVAKKSFRTGAAAAISKKLREEIEARDLERRGASSERGLVVIKDAKLEEKFGSFGYKHMDVNTGDHRAFNRGVEAGRNVSINKPIEGSSSGSVQSKRLSAS